MSERHNLHATGLVLDRQGLLLRGPSGAGKSLLALALLDEWEVRGRGARLVSDDRVEIAAGRNGLLMYPPGAIAGLIELRGRGIVGRPFASRAPVHLVIDLVPDLIRMVEEEDLSTELLGVKVARCPVPAAGIVDSLHQLLLVREALRALSTAKRSPRQKST